jgi:hypothetical protein
LREKTFSHNFSTIGAGRATSAGNTTRLCASIISTNDSQRFY